MVVYPNAKINIGLSVTGKREDGYHNLETVFYPIGLSDVLEVNRCEGAYGECFIENTGIAVNCPKEKNLVVKAYKLLASAYRLPAVCISLHKEIPYGAGLGGGSSDAAFMLKTLNDYFKLGISEAGLCNYASRLGSDCPFFIKNRPAFAHGRGELLEEISLSLGDYYVMIAKPDCEVSTEEAYRGIVPGPAGFELRKLNTLPVENWRKSVKNDFEHSVFLKHPEILKVKEDMYEFGAVYASMTGSGSGVYGLFRKGGRNVKDAFEGAFVWTDNE